MNISQRILYVCMGICSFFILSLISCITSSPVIAKSCMNFLGAMTHPGGANGVAVVGTTAYVTDGDSGLQIINIHDYGFGNRPTVKTNPATHITTYDATLNGIVNAHGLKTLVWFDYGTTSDSYEFSSSEKTVKASSGKDEKSFNLIPAYTYPPSTVHFLAL